MWSFLWVTTITTQVLPLCPTTNPFGARVRNFNPFRKNVKCAFCCCWCTIAAFVYRLPFVKASSVSYAILKLFSYVSFEQKGAELSKFTTSTEKSQLLQNCNWEVFSSATWLSSLFEKKSICTLKDVADRWPVAITQKNLISMDAKKTRPLSDSLDLLLDA